MDSFNVLENGQVMRVYNIRDNVVEVHHDMLYHVKLVSDKSVILPNNADSATVTATVYDYLDNLVNYAGDIHFRLGKSDPFALPAVGGVAVIEVTSDHVNMIDIAAWIDNGRSGVCVIDAKTV
ncbi:hypothetical protein [Cohnella sp.]|uniref:hypothetical protein n=1 Tax=Cohnella sp. TaxID=1883426 RepID=UPI0037046A9F